MRLTCNYVELIVGALHGEGLEELGMLLVAPPRPLVAVAVVAGRAVARAAPAAGGWAVDIHPANGRWKCDVQPVLGTAEAVEVRARVAEERVKTLVRDAAAPNAVTAEDLRDVLARMAPALEQIAADEDDAVAPETHPEIAAAIAAIGEEKKRRARE